MHTDADDISRHDAFRHNRLQRFIDENGIACCLRCRRRKDKQPPRRNDSSTKGIVAGIYEMNAHRFRPFAYDTATPAQTLLPSPALAIRSLLSVHPTVGAWANESVQVRKHSIVP